MSLFRFLRPSKCILRMQRIEAINGLVQRLGVLLEFRRGGVDVAADDGDLLGVEGMRMSRDTSP